MLRSVTTRQLFGVSHTVTRALAATAAPSCEQALPFCSQPASTESDQAICRFGSAYSDRPTLAQSITECVANVKQQLGDDTQMDLCQLLVSLGHGEHLRLAPMVGCHCFPNQIPLASTSFPQYIEEESWKAFWKCSHDVSISYSSKEHHVGQLDINEDIWAFHQEQAAMAFQ